jgi:hypothetical protein
MFILERVFFHELGHYTAHRINEIYLGGLGVSEFKLSPCGADEYGHIELIKPIDHQEGPVPIERLPQLLASLWYGCLFQSYYIAKSTEILNLMNVKKLLGDCLGVTGEGRCDMNLWYNSLKHHGLYEERHKFVAIEMSHLEIIFEQESINPFIKIEPAKYVLTQRDNIIDLKTLEEDIYNLIIYLSPLYLDLIEKYRGLLST